MMKNPITVRPLRPRQFSLAYLMLLVTVAAVGAAFVRLAIVQGESLLFWFDAVLVVLVGAGKKGG